ncbi:right-handed parallel beta-helix repeat-containing protein [Actinomadura litoris]|uniref:Right handed beta helix domain-containing protein n=1 Tax=Actinomadura litoris TaxID=2678616 RepID=A0A7K1KY86_9ACTN|nr:right-handed parallel beta-helix repeat-containing protein [Actinomadura litoris]MUN37172.1 hypothetical protein [Actinomadura litoris]
MRKLVPAITVAALCLAGCSDGEEGAKASATAPVPPPVSQPAAPTGPTVSVPPLELKSPAPAGGEGSRITWPDLKTVGVPRGRRLRPSGPITIRKRGAVIDGLLVRTEINVAASDVTIRNTHLVGAGQWGIIQRKGASGLRVENSEINGDGRTKVQYGILNQGGMVTVRRSYVHTVANGINTDHGLIEDCLIQKLKEFPGDHVTGVQSNSGPAPGLSLVVRHNVVLNPVSQTSAISIYQDFGRAHDVTIDGNLLSGGGYALYGGKGRFGRTSNIRVVRNVFSRKMFRKGGFFGPVTSFEPRGPGNVWKGNVWAETGKAVLP